jgi:uncharacterized membrane protein (GlpM family)
LDADSLFLLKLLLSFALGGTYIAFTIWLSEKYGSLIGGIMLGLPSTSLVGIIFLAWTIGDGATHAALASMPASIAANALFLSAFIYLYRRGFAIALAGSLLLWFAIAFFVISLKIENMAISLLIAGIFLAIFVPYLRKQADSEAKPRRSSAGEFIFRAAFCGSIVAIAVMLGKTMGPLYGGTFATFPAAFSSSVILLSRKHGIGFTASVAKAMPIGTIGTILFYIMLYSLYPALDFMAALALAFIGSLLAGVVSYKMFGGK